MNEKANIDGEEYSFIEVIPVLNDKAHLMGRDPYCRDVVAIYPMLEDDTTRLLAADFDEASWQADVAALRETCMECHLTPVNHETAHACIRRAPE